MSDAHGPTKAPFIPHACHRWGVILAGGEGLRLRSMTRRLSGDDRPKQFCSLLNDRTLLASTRLRIAREIAEERTILVLTQSHERFYRQDIAGLPPAQLIEQPANRGTLPAILWSLMRIAEIDDRSIVSLFPSDHHYADEEKFMDGVAEAIEIAESDGDSAIILGTPALHAEIEYGWIEPAEQAGSGSRRTLNRVKRFWEKPSAPVAEQLLAQGCLWNTFVIVGHVMTLLAMIRSTVPHYSEGVRLALDALQYGRQALNQAYGQLDSADFSSLVLATNVSQLAVLGLDDIGWTDLGAPHRLRAVLDQTANRKPLQRSSGIITFPLASSGD